MRRVRDRPDLDEPVYRFASTWSVAAPADRCWTLLESALDGRRLEWWPHVRLRRVPAPATGQDRAGLLHPGDEIVMRVRSPLGYALASRLTVTSVDRRAITAASTGDLEGEGSVRLSGDRDGTRIAWTWDVTPRRRWMLVAEPVLRPLFTCAHNVVMRGGERGLRRACENR